MTKEEINQKSQERIRAKIMAIETLCKSLHVTVAAKQLIDPNGFINNIVYYTDNEKYEEDNKSNDKKDDSTNEDEPTEEKDSKTIEKDTKAPTPLK